ncbi:RIP metalloprotease RseP [soil metagenome]
MNFLLTSILFFFITLSILVIVHEFGHFWVARRLGIKVLCFSVGFGKPLWSFRDKTGTEYILSALPLGGYVKMLDEREGTVPPEELPRAFNRQPLLSRIAVVCAGPLFNLLFAFLVYWLIFVIGQSVAVPIIGSVKTASIASKAKLSAGDEIVAVDGVSTRSWPAISFALLEHLGEQVKLQIDVKKQHSDESRAYILDLGAWSNDNKILNPLESLGIVPYHPPLPTVIGAVVANGPAARVGILAEDRILAVDGKTVSHWEELVNIIQKNPKKRVNLEVLRQNNHLNIGVIPELHESETNKKTGFLGIQSKPPIWPAELLRNEQFSVLGAWSPAFIETWKMTKFSVAMLGKLITGKIATTNMSGPVGIASTAGLSISLGWTAYLSFLALLSINLAILNMLPIPLLDGSHLVYYLIEFVTGKPVSNEVQNLGAWVGMILLAGLMLIAFFNDVSRLLINN